MMQSIEAVCKARCMTIKNLYNRFIYEPMRVKAIQDLLPKIIKK